MMSPEQRTVFLESRQKGIGGSDAGSLLSNQITVEYGCERALWLRLSGVPPDNPDAPTEPMILGSLLEPWVARAYADSTGRQVEEAGLKKHDKYESLQVHVDRLIYPLPTEAHEKPGVLEIKTVGREMMRKIQDEGIPVDYIAQWEHGAACYDTDWGAFAVGTREDLLPLVAIELASQLAGEPQPELPRRPKIVSFEMTSNPAIRNAIEDYGPKFWATLGDETKIPPRLEPEDPRCGRCRWKNHCQGAAIMAGVEPEAHIPRRPDLALLVQEYRTNVALVEDCEELIAATEKKFKDAMGNTTAAKVPVPTENGVEWKNALYRLRKGAERVDGRAMAVQYDWLRRAAITAKLPGAELVQPSSGFTRTGMPSRPLLLGALLPKKTKSKGEVPELDEE